MNEPMHIVVGASAFLNAAPLTFGFRKHPHVTLVDAPPSELPTMLRVGKLDMALVPVVDALFSDDLGVIPGLGVGADGPVRSVKLRCQIPLAQVGTVCRDAASHTSNSLARLLMRRHFMRDVGWLPPSDPADAAVVIGDPALLSEAGVAEEYDLAEEWKRMTGLPFVFAVWAYRRDHPATGWLQRCAEDSYAVGRAQLDQIVAEGAASLGLSQALVRDYVSGALEYELDETDRIAMQQFHDMLVAEGIDPMAHSA